MRWTNFFLFVADQDPTTLHNQSSFIHNSSIAAFKTVDFQVGLRTGYIKFDNPHTTSSYFLTYSP